MLDNPKVSADLRARLVTADANGDGLISLEELLAVVDSEISYKKERNLLRKIVAVIGIAVLLIISAVVGLTYAVVELSKDTKVDGQVQVNKATGLPVGTASVRYTADLRDAWSSTNMDEFSTLDTIQVPYGEDGGVARFAIRSMRLVPGKRLEVDTTTEGVNIIIEEGEVTVNGTASSTPWGRRLLQANETVVTGGGILVATPETPEDVAPFPIPDPKDAMAPSAAPGPEDTVAPSMAPEPTEAVPPSTAPEPAEAAPPSTAPGPADAVAPAPSPLASTQGNASCPCCETNSCRFDGKSWMTDLYDQAGLRGRKLRQLFIPGTHDTMTYDLSLNDNVGGGASCNQDIQTLKSYMGSFLQGAINKFIRAAAIANTRSLRAQLDMGIRMVDFRPYPAGLDDWYFSHCKVTERKVPDYLGEMKSWLDSVKARQGKEVIIIDWRIEDYIKPGSGLKWDSSLHTRGFRYLEQYLGDYMPQDVKSINFDSTLEEITKNGPAVLVLADTPGADPWADASSPQDKALVSRIMKRSEYLEQPYGQEDTASGVRARMQGHLQQWKAYTGSKLFSILGVITCGGSTYNDNKSLISEMVLGGGPASEGKRSFILTYIDRQTEGRGLPYDNNVVTQNWLAQNSIDVGERGMAFMYDNPHDQDIQYMISLNTNTKSVPGKFSYPECPICEKTGLSDVDVKNTGGCNSPDWKVVKWRAAYPEPARCQCEYLPQPFEAGCGNGNYNGANV